MENIEDIIKRENWKKAKGVKASYRETNSALALRDYSVKCEASHLITIIEGYHIWWCSTHHQPLAWCEKEKQKQGIVEEIEKVFPKKCDSNSQVRDIRGKIMFKCSGRDCTDCLIEIRDNLEYLLNQLKQN